jgi:hypothetical protein
MAQLGTLLLRYPKNVLGSFQILRNAHHESWATLTLHVNTTKR